MTHLKCMRRYAWSMASTHTHTLKYLHTCLCENSLWNSLMADFIFLQSFECVDAFFHCFENKRKKIRENAYKSDVAQNLAQFFSNVVDVGGKKNYSNFVIYYLKCDRFACAFRFFLRCPFISSSAIHFAKAYLLVLGR